MTPVPLDLPLRPSEAAELGNLIFEQAERKPLTDEVRNRIAARASVLRLETLHPYFGSLERDPVHPSAYYLAVDIENGPPLLLHLTLATAPTSSVFYTPLLIGRMRRANGPEMVINAIPFGPADCEHVETFCSRIAPAFLPRPHGQNPSLTVSGSPPETFIPAAFEAFRAIQKRTGRNLASFEAPLCPVLWSAIRAGWRGGYNATIGFEIAPASLAGTKAAIRANPGYSTFAFALPVPPVPDADEERLALQFGPALRAAEELHECVREARSAIKTARSFDFELSLESAALPTTPSEASFCLDWLRQHGHAAQLLAPRLAPAAELDPQLEALESVARLYQARLSIRPMAAHQPFGRVNYKLACEGADPAARIRAAASDLLG